MHIPIDLYSDLIIGLFVALGVVVIYSILTKDPTGKR